MNIQGQWTGTIIFGKEYADLENKELYFDMDIITQNNSSQITGSAIDIGGVGVSSDPAVINGSFSGNEISFIKQYASFHYYDNGKTIIDKSQPGSEIHYSGHYDDLEHQFYGNWIIKWKAKLIGVIPINYINTGTWIMRRK